MELEIISGTVIELVGLANEILEINWQVINGGTFPIKKYIGKLLQNSCYMNCTALVGFLYPKID